MTRHSIVVYSLLAGCGVSIASAAAAQDTSPPVSTNPDTTAAADADGTVGEIIVTANRRAENVQKVPISISVLSNKDLTAAGVNNASQLQITTTNMQISVLNTKPLVYIRGMGSAALTPGSETAVGLYMDGVYLPESASIDQTFLDIERVEVLKGPQGTLYGRNTTAGAINFVTRDPSKARTAELIATGGTWGTKILQAYVSTGPGRVSASLAGVINRHHAFLRNLVPGRPDFNDRKEEGVRGKLRFEASDAWTITLSADYDHRDDFSGNGFISITDRPTPADPALGGHFTTIKNPRHTYADFPSSGDQYRNYGASMNIRGELGFADFVSISGYRNVKEWSAPDADASDLPLTNFVASNELKNWSQEFQLISSNPSRFSWILGLYTFHSKGGLDPVGIWNPGNSGAADHALTNADLIVRGVGSAHAYAAYGQGTYELVDGLKLTGGLRYSYEQRTLDRQEVIVPGFGVVFSEPDAKKHWASLDPKIGIDYSWNRQLVYASFSRGFRSGSYNLISPGDKGPVGPEKVNAFEVGGKHTIVSGVRFNWAGFYYKYKDLQVSREVNNGQGSLFSTQNAASAKIKGFEADLSITAVPHLTLNAGIGYLDAKYTSFPNASAFVPVVGGYGFVQSSVDASGRPLARAPKWSMSGQATYDIPIGTSHLELNGTVYYTSKYFLDTPSNISSGKYTIVNARATYYFPGDHISVAVFATNLFNKVYLSSASTNAFTFIGQPNDPRIIGGSVALKF